MEPTTLHMTAPSVPKDAGEPAREPASGLPAEPPVEFDRRGKPLPPRQRVGGIITPQ